MAKNAAPKGNSPTWLIEARIKALNDWRGQRLAYIRALIKQADLDMVEEWKWRGVPADRMTGSSAPARRIRAS